MFSKLDNMNSLTYNFCAPSIKPPAKKTKPEGSDAAAKLLRAFPSNGFAHVGSVAMERGSKLRSSITSITGSCDAHAAQAALRAEDAMRYAHRCLAMTGIDAEVDAMKTDNRST